MKNLIVTSLICLLSVWSLTNVAQADRDAVEPPERQDIDPAPIPVETAFATIDITIDPKGQPLGAYQFEMTVNHGAFMVVGIEAGEHAAFDHGRPPYYDRKVDQQHTDRLIVAEYARPKHAAKDLPTTPTRVVTVHFAILEHAVGPGPQTLQLTLTTAGNAAGERIDADISYTFRTPERPE